VIIHGEGFALLTLSVTRLSLAAVWGRWPAEDFVAILRAFFSLLPIHPFDNQRQIDYLSHSPCVSIIAFLVILMAANLSLLQLPSSTPMR
jgi:hypothetical protein